MSEKREPQHLKLFTSRFKWDWRRENPVELVILVFAISCFFLLPRAGCGVTDASVSSVDVMAKPGAEAGQKGGAPVAPKEEQAPQG